MTKSIRFLGTAFAFLCILASCKKEIPQNKIELKNIVLDVTLNAGKLYSLPLNTYSDVNDIVLLSKQANSFQISEITNTENIKTYNFLKNASTKTTVSKETVILRIYEPRNGIHCEKTDITIHFTIL
jgi:hypothetical protein